MWKYEHVHFEKEIIPLWKIKKKYIGNSAFVKQQQRSNAFYGASEAYQATKIIVLPEGYIKQLMIILGSTILQTHQCSKENSGIKK